MRFFVLIFVLTLASTTAAALAAEMTVYKSPYCGCCAAWVTHVEDAGHTVKVVNTEDMDQVKQTLGVPGSLHSCHTAVVDGYLIEGHVPVADIDRLLAERPEAKGLAVPGMPTGSPGMEMPETDADRYNVILFTAESGSVYTQY